MGYGENQAPQSILCGPAAHFEIFTTKDLGLISSVHQCHDLVDSCCSQWLTVVDELNRRLTPGQWEITRAPVPKYRLHQITPRREKLYNPG